MPKVTDLTSLVTPSKEDLLMIVDDPNGEPLSKKIDLLTLFGNVRSNTSIHANCEIEGLLIVSNNMIRISKSHATPANSTALTITKGSMFFDANNLYLATANNVVKRLPLSLF